MTGQRCRKGRSAECGIEARLADRGIVTAELAMGFAVIVIMLGFVLGAVSVTIAQLRCVDAAFAVARAAARGEDATHLGERMAPRGSRVGIATDASGLIRATVRVRVQAWGSMLPAVEVIGVAHAQPEPGQELADERGHDDDSAE